MPVRARPNAPEPVGQRRQKNPSEPQVVQNTKEQKAIGAEMRAMRKALTDTAERIEKAVDKMVGAMDRLEARLVTMDGNIVGNSAEIRAMAGASAEMARELRAMAMKQDNRV